MSLQNSQFLTNNLQKELISSNNSQSATLSRRSIRESDEPYDPYENLTPVSHQRQQRTETPSSRLQNLSRPSSSSGSTRRTLRRTPKHGKRPQSKQRSTSVGKKPPRENSGVRFTEPVRQLQDNLSEDFEGSTTPRASIELPERSSAPHRSARISRRTASAILYALEEAIRKPNPFTPDLVEENASMSDLVGGGPSQSGGGIARASNGGSRASAGPVPVPQYAATGVRGPRDIMRERQAREARRKAEAEAASETEREDEDQRRAREERRISAERRAAAGDLNAGGGASSGYRRTSGIGAVRRSVGEGAQPQEMGRRQGDRINSENGARISQSTNAQPTGRTQEPISAQRGAVGDSGGNGGASRARGASVSQVQSKPVLSQQPTGAPAPQYRNAQSANLIPEPLASSSTRQNVGTGPTTQAQEGPSAAQSATQPPQPRPPTEGAQPRNAATASSFPHAFERWETLSSHWEGLTSYWIRRLENNSEEVRREPLTQQMSRQITDLSAAGANLFHAVVELQRLRASSERKFQRWFFETRAEQERAQEMQGEMENTLRVERQARADAVSSAARMEQEKGTADKMVSEMKRELQISKEEARRAWEELGRREQEERDRTISLRDGQPTLVGGVQVVPMMQAVPSRQGSISMPPTREGPYEGGPNRSAMGGSLAAQEPTESPVEGQQGYSAYDPEARSTTDTDPFVEGDRDAPGPRLQHEPDLPAIPASTYPQYPPRSSSITATPTTRATHPSSQPTASTAQPAATAPATGGTYLHYSQAPPTQVSAAPFYQHQQGISLLGQETPRATEADERSYVPSNEDTISEEDYEIDENGNTRYDAQGRPILFRRLQASEGSDDDDDVREELERERAYQSRYGGVSNGGYSQQATRTAGGQAGPGDDGYGPATADYSGTGYGAGWESVSRHHHPTRLSDVPEEDERSRTSASRASQISRGFH
ncbi:MAG: hypothetical protein M1827_007423 [Pycnora praestabilis]|nr:MAG: hypothetical protein M1827_007423 [Pycnora praestabilis]